MWILFRVGIGVVNAVHDAISERAQVCGTRNHPAYEVKEALNRLGHGPVLVRCIPMKKERMNENCQIPMRNEENENDWHEKGLESWEKYRPEQGPKVETGNNIRMNGRI